MCFIASQNIARERPCLIDHVNLLMISTLATAMLNYILAPAFSLQKVERRGFSLT